MMTTLSIDTLTTISGASSADATPVPATPSLAVDLTALPHPELAEEQAPFGGLAELVADNAALGEALQSLVDALDKSAVRGEPGESALPQPPRTAVEKPVVVGEAVGLPGVKVKPEEFVVENLLPGVRPEMVVVVEKPVVRGEPGVFALPQPSETEVNGSQPPRATDASVDNPVAAVVSETPVREGVRRANAAAPAVDKSKTETSETIVLQAAPSVAVPIVGDAVALDMSATGSVAPVAAVSPVDVSTMFIAAAEEVAEAVAVSPALMRGEAGEIRVQLKPDVLEGTEVVVAVDGKKMDVTFVPTVTHVADTVAANQSLVQQQLAAKIAGFEITVAVAQTVATNVSVGVASSASVQAAVARARRTNGRA